MARAASSRRASVSPAKTRERTKAPHSAADSHDKNWAAGSVGSALSPIGIFILFIAPTLCQFLAVATSHGTTIDLSLGISGLFRACFTSFGDLAACGSTGWAAMTSISSPTFAAAQFLLCFFVLAALLDKLLPGEVCHGPVTQTGHVPAYVDNAVLHCILFSLCFFIGSNFVLGIFRFDVIYEVFPAAILMLNAFGFCLGAVLNWKGLHAPSTRDCGSTGSWLDDFKWGTELYPRILGFDVKRLINCRISMTLWQLAGLSFAYKSYLLHGAIDYGLLLSAISQYLYLAKFFVWEIGYMKSIDIIVDRAGFEIQWGCLVFVPSIYTLHSRMSVQSPSRLSLPVAACIFAVGLAGVYLNWFADEQRQAFRESNGKMLIGGRPPIHVKARYTCAGTGNGGRSQQKTALLLADGMWGPARHFHYVFELIAAWSWCLLANPIVNGTFACTYAIFLTLLLLHRAKRDEDKCLAKYGDDYRKLMALVPYRIFPGVY